MTPEPAARSRPASLRLLSRHDLTCAFTHHVTVALRMLRWRSNDAGGSSTGQARLPQQGDEGIDRMAKRAVVADGDHIRTGQRLGLGARQPFGDVIGGFAPARAKACG